MLTKLFFLIVKNPQSAGRSGARLHTQEVPTIFFYVRGFRNSDKAGIRAASVKRAECAISLKCTDCVVSVKRDVLQFCQSGRVPRFSKSVRLRGPNKVVSRMFSLKSAECPAFFGR